MLRVVVVDFGCLDSGEVEFGVVFSVFRMK